MFLGLDKLFEVEEFFLMIFHGKNYVSLVLFPLFKEFGFGVGGAFDPVS